MTLDHDLINGVAVWGVRCSINISKVALTLDESLSDDVGIVVHL
jgi:hypothetical protein